MSDRWLTIASPTEEAMVNPLVAGCERGYVPDEVTILSNPKVRADAEPVGSLIDDVCQEYGTDAEVTFHDVDTETEFADIAAFFGDAITNTRGDDSVAVDITPGRKFMSAIAFQAGVRFGADHVFYLLLDSSEYYGRVYPDIPATATELIDFSEVV